MNEIYRGIPVQSDAEIFVLDWLFELKDRGFIHSIERSPELLISKGLENKYTQRKQLKTKVNHIPKVQVLLTPHYYTPEFNVIWYPSAPEGLVWPISKIGIEGWTSPLIGHSFPITDQNDRDSGQRQHSLLTYIEVKPAFDFKNMSRLFKLNRLWVWESRKMFINLLEPTSLFKYTFTPEAYLKTRKRRTERDIKWKVITCDEFLKSIGYEAPISEPLEDRPHQEQGDQGV